MKNKTDCSPMKITPNNKNKKINIHLLVSGSKGQAGKKSLSADNGLNK